MFLYCPEPYCAHAAAISIAAGSFSGLLLFQSPPESSSPVAMLSITSLSKSYGSKLVLNDISIGFEDGKVHGIAGLNGAGKTTFFKCISGLESYSGSIAHPAYPILKNHLAYVAAEPYFFPRITGREYLEFIRHARDVPALSDSVTNLFDLPLDEYIHRYSTGMKRKLTFMGAMIGDAAIYILDEPFNGVDIQSNLQLKKKVQALKQSGKTVLLSSHILSSMVELCDAVHLLKAGRFVKSYQPEDYSILEEDMLLG